MMGAAKKIRASVSSSNPLTSVVTDSTKGGASFGVGEDADNSAMEGTINPA